MRLGTTRYVRQIDIIDAVRYYRYDIRVGIDSLYRLHGSFRMKTDRPETAACLIIDELCIVYMYVFSIVVKYSPISEDSMECVHGASSDHIEADCYKLIVSQSVL